MIKIILLSWLGVSIICWISTIISDNRSWSLMDFIFLISPLAFIILGGVYIWLTIMGIIELLNPKSKIRVGQYFDNSPDIKRSEDYRVYKIYKVNLYEMYYKDVKHGRESNRWILDFKRNKIGRKYKFISKLKGMLYED